MPRGVYERTDAHRAALRGVPKSDAHRQQMADRQRGKCASDETRAKMSAARLGRKNTPEHSAAISRAKKGVPQSIPQTPEQREKNRLAQLGNQRARGIKHSAEQRERRAQLTRQMWKEGVYDANQRTWGRAGVHAGVRMRCLNSEGVFARDLDRGGITWQYEPRRFSLSWCTYRPDFYLPEFDIWIEVKGWPQQSGNWQEKVDAFRRETGKCLIVVFMRELSSRTYGVGE